MAQARLSVKEGTDVQPSHEAIDHSNRAESHTAWLRLDDVNVDLFSFFGFIATLVSFFIAQTPWKTTIPIAAGSIGLFRSVFPRPKVPQGLVLITGATSGIGAELAYIFASKGHDLILVGRAENQLDAVNSNVKDKFNVDAYTIASDLSLPGSAKELYDHVKSKGFTVNVLVNNAGLGGAGDTLDQPIELAERMTHLNCISLVQLTQLFGNDMIDRGQGWLLHTSSVGGWMASPHQNIYHATKHYVRAFSEALSIELRAFPGIVNTQLMPGPTDTQFFTRGNAEHTIAFATEGSVQDAKSVAWAGYQGLVAGKRMVASSWNVVFMAVLFQLIPRSLHLTLSAFFNSPRQKAAKQPEKDQWKRGRDLDSKN